MVEKRAHGRSPWRDAFEAVVNRPNRGGVTFGITEERAGGAQVVPLLRADGFAVGEQYATEQEAFDALLAFHSEFELYRAGRAAPTANGSTE